MCEEVTPKDLHLHLRSEGLPTCQARQRCPMRADRSVAVSCTSRETSEACEPMSMFLWTRRREMSSSRPSGGPQLGSNSVDDWQRETSGLPAMAVLRMWASIACGRLIGMQRGGYQPVNIQSVFEASHCGSVGSDAPAVGPLPTPMQMLGEASFLVPARRDDMILRVRQPSHVRVRGVTQLTGNPSPIHPLVPASVL